MAAGAFGAIGLGSTIAGGILGATGAKQQGDAQQAMYNYKAGVARINADIDRQNATWARDKGDKEALQYGMKAAQQAGQIRASQGASGLDVNSGSNLDVQTSQKAVTKMDTDMIRANAAKIAFDYERQAVMDENQAGLDTMAGSYAKQAGDIKATQSILGTVSTVSSKWSAGNSAGLWG